MQKALVKTCTKCHSEQPIEEFNKDAHKSDGLASSCSTCSKKQKKAYYERTKPIRLQDAYRWQRNNPEKRKEIQRRSQKKHKIKIYINWLARKYGVAPAILRGIRETANYSCEICGVEEKNYRKTLCIDHNHATGALRGLLCDNCNKGIGCFKDNQKLLRKTIKYLEKYKCNQGLT